MLIALTFIIIGIVGIAFSHNKRHYNEICERDGEGAAAKKIKAVRASGIFVLICGGLYLVMVLVFGEGSEPQAGHQWLRQATSALIHLLIAPDGDGQSDFNMIFNILFVLVFFLSGSVCVAVSHNRKYFNSILERGGKEAARRNTKRLRIIGLILVCIAGAYIGLLMAAGEIPSW